MFHKVKVCDDDVVCACAYASMKYDKEVYAGFISPTICFTHSEDREKK